MAGSRLSIEKQEEYAKVVEAQMRTRKFYLNPDITINEMALTLGITPKELSQVINQSFHKHFFDFINSYRIEEAKEMLKDPSNSMTIQEVMYSVGFSSKFVFQHYF